MSRNNRYYQEEEEEAAPVAVVPTVRPKTTMATAIANPMPSAQVQAQSQAAVLPSSAAQASVTRPIATPVSLPTDNASATSISPSSPSDISVQKGEFSPQTEQTARYVGLGIFGLLSLTAVIILANWGLRKFITWRRNKKNAEESSPFPIQEPTFPMFYEKPASDKDSYRTQSFDQPHLPQYQQDPYGFEQSMSRPPLAPLPAPPVAPPNARMRSNTTGSMGPQRTHRRPAPPPLELREVPKSGSFGSNTPRPVFYTHQGHSHSQGSMGNDPFHDDYRIYHPQPQSPLSPLSPQPIAPQQYSYIPPMSPMSPLHPPSPSQMGEAFPRI